MTVDPTRHQERGDDQSNKELFDRNAAEKQQQRLRTVERVGNHSERTQTPEYLQIGIVRHEIIDKRTAVFYPAFSAPAHTEHGITSEILPRFFKERFSAVVVQSDIEKRVESIFQLLSEYGYAYRDRDKSRSKHRNMEIAL